MTSLSSTEKETASPCVPSRSVVSKVWIRICFLSQAETCATLLGDRRRLLFLRDAGFLPFLQECHHLAQLAAHSLDVGIARGFAHRQELVTPGFVLVDPFASELTGLNLAQNLFHLIASLLVHNTRAACVIAVLRRIGYRETHITEAAFIDKIDNQL